MASYSWVSFSHERQSIKIPTPESHRARALETVLGAILRWKYFRNFRPCPSNEGLSQKRKFVRPAHTPTHTHTQTDSLTRHPSGPVSPSSAEPSWHAINSRRLGEPTLFLPYLLDENFLDFAILLPFLHLLLLSST